jgi:hypothetical protein
VPSQDRLWQYRFAELRHSTAGRAHCSFSSEATVPVAGDRGLGAGGGVPQAGRRYGGGDAGADKLEQIDVRPIKVEASFHPAATHVARAK